MNTITIRQIVTIVTIFPALLLSGCLAKEKPDSGFVGNGPPEQNSPPTISGNPQTTVMMGDSYSFTPTASDPDGDTLTFSLQNKPVWADFDSSTGTISGIPLLGDIGSYLNIDLSVTDGQNTTAMANFTIDVTQVGTASTTLSWVAPTLNDDGSALTDLAGYTIYYGTASGNYTSQILIDNASITTYLLENLSPDTYYFAAKAFNSSGVESSYSGEAVKSLN